MAVAGCTEEEGTVVFSLWLGWESSSALLCALHRLWNGCHTPGLASSSEVQVQDLPPTCNVHFCVSVSWVKAEPVCEEHTLNSPPSVLQQ